MTDQAVRLIGSVLCAMYVLLVLSLALGNPQNSPSCAPKYTVAFNK